MKESKHEDLKSDEKESFFGEIFDSNTGISKLKTRRNRRIEAVSDDESNNENPSNLDLYSKKQNKLNIRKGQSLKGDEVGGLNEKEDLNSQLQREGLVIDKARRGRKKKNELEHSFDQVVEASDQKMNHDLLKSGEKVSISEKDFEDDENIKNLKTGNQEANIEFSNETDLVDYVFDLILNPKTVEAFLKKTNEEKEKKDPLLENKILEEYTEKKDTPEVDPKSTAPELTPAMPDQIKENIKDILENNKIVCEKFGEDKEQFPATGTSDETKTCSTSVPEKKPESEKSDTQKMNLKILIENQISVSPKKSISFLSLKKLLGLKKDQFKNSVLNFMITKPETDEFHQGISPRKMKQKIQKFDQYITNDNMEFMSVIIYLLYTHKSEIKVEHPLLIFILKLLTKRLLNTTDNYIQCEKSFRIIEAAFEQNLQERIADLKSFLLNQKLKNIADLKIKTQTMMKKINIDGQPNVAKAKALGKILGKRHGQVEGFIGNFVERDGFRHLNMKKIMKGQDSLKVPEIKGKFSFSWSDLKGIDFIVVWYILRYYSQSVAIFISNN